MKKAFTLIELLLSIVIFTFVYSVMSNILNYLNSSESLIKQTYLKHSKKEKLIKTLYTDILENQTITLIKVNKNISKLDINTTNSLYNLSIPCVQWKVNTKNNLIRIEATSDIKKGSYYADDFGKVKIFRVFQNFNSFLIFIKFINNKEIIFKVQKR